MKQTIYKVMFGYGGENFVTIKADELEKAVYCHLTGKVGVFQGGTVTGSHIIAITPDVHAMMGWNYSYKLGPDDYSEAQGRINEAKNLFARVQDGVRNIIERGGLLGTTDYSKPAEIPKEIGDGTKKLADKMKIA